ncbi:MAG: response regulator [Bdellovibrionales bacterium]|nr:response regulator [Bdellovibrionales bacterium]
MKSCHAHSLEPQTFSHVLVVDDDPFAQRRFTSFLSHTLGLVRFSFASSYQEGFDSLNAYPRPHLLILDYFLDGPKSGLDLLQDTMTQMIPPATLMTSAMSLAAFRRLLPAHLSDIQFLPKPFTLADLKKALAELRFIA